jgi:hypothetical protein
MLACHNRRRYGFKNTHIQLAAATPHSVAAIETDGERIHAFYTIANPDKLRSFRSLVTESGDVASSE